MTRASRNPDVRLRELERRAAAGDLEARIRLLGLRLRLQQIYAGEARDELTQLVRERVALYQGRVTGTGILLARDPWRVWVAVHSKRGSHLLTVEFQIPSMTAKIAVQPGQLVLRSMVKSLRELVSELGMNLEFKRIELRPGPWRPERLTNPDVRLRELERRGAGGDLEAQLQLAKQRIRAGTAADEDVWLVLVHDVEQVLATEGWIAQPWFNPARVFEPGRAHRAWNRAVGNMQISDPASGEVGWDATTAQLVVMFDPLEAEIIAGVGGEALPRDREFAEVVRQVLLPHMEGILL